MKKEIHPEYHSEAKVKCSCGAEFTVGSTMAEIEVEICGSCHPFFTGVKKILDTGGRVERFKKRTEAAKSNKSVKKTESKDSKVKVQEDKK